MAKLLLILAAAVVVGGCSNLKGRAVPTELTGSASAKGISYYLAKPKFSIVRKTERAGKPAIPRYELEVGWEADSSRRFEVGMRGGVFVSDAFELQINSEGVTTGLTSKRTDETGKAIAGLSTFAATIAEAVAASSGTAATGAAGGAGRGPGRGTARAVVPPSKLPEHCSEECAPVAGGPVDVDAKTCSEAMLKEIKAAFETLGISGACTPNLKPQVEPGLPLPPDLELPILSKYRCLAALDDKTDPSIGAQLGKLRTELSIAIARAIELREANSSEVVRLKGELAAAVSMVDDRALQDRKNAVLALLKRTPTLKNYAELSNEFDRLAKDLKSLNALPDGPAVEATDATSRIDRSIVEETLCGPFAPETKDNSGLPEIGTKSRRVMLAKARVRVGQAKAVVIKARVGA